MRRKIFIDALEYSIEELKKKIKENKDFDQLYFIGEPGDDPVVISKEKGLVIPSTKYVNKKMVSRIIRVLEA
jgi:hypothetical protein